MYRGPMYIYIGMGVSVYVAVNKVVIMPQDFLDQQGWVEGDTLDWKDNEDGSWTLSKVEK